MTERDRAGRVSVSVASESLKDDLDRARIGVEFRPWDLMVSCKRWCPGTLTLRDDRIPRNS